MEAMQNKHLQGHNRRYEMFAVIGVWCQKTTADCVDNITPQRDRQRVWRKRRPPRLEQAVRLHRHRWRRSMAS